MIKNDLFYLKFMYVNNYFFYICACNEKHHVNQYKNSTGVRVQVYEKSIEKSEHRCTKKMHEKVSAGAGYRPKIYKHW